MSPITSPKVDFAYSFTPPPFLSCTPNSFCLFGPFFRPQDQKMKKTLLAIAFGLASSTAFADTGTITFAGSIKPGGTCPIDLVIPGTGTSIPRLEMGSLRAEDFPATGSKSKLVRFALKVTPGAGCVVGTQDGYVTYKPVYDTAGTKLYGLDRIDPEAAKGIALAILDRAQNYVEPNKESIAYPLDDTLPSEMDFFAHYESTANTVEPGHANVLVEYTFALK